MTTDTNYASDEELFRRLQGNLHEATEEATRPARRARLAQETTDLVRTLAGRIYDQPDRWGLDRVPAESRDDVACDVLIALLQQATSAGIRSSVAEWFGRQAESRLREAVARTGEAAPRLRERQVPGAISQLQAQEGVGDKLPPSLLDAADGPWQRFEQQFPREALALRLRYFLGRTPEEMMAILDIPSSGVVGAQLSRARGHMRSFLESAGYDPKAIAGMLSQFGGEQE
jgi:DNA-directed RNA polymerase specialized sigma24 family protein